jgi:5-methylcytosine-specific restriction endonuclease McrA
MSLTKCWCGCNKDTKNGNRFINGHNSKYMSIETKTKISIALLGRKHIGRKVSELGRRRMSESHKGIAPSLECRLKRSASMIGRKQTEEHIRKRVESRIKNDTYSHSDDTKELIGQSRKGYKWSEQTRKKMEIKIKRGADSNLWQGGVSSEEYGPEFTTKLKREIKERDNYQCQMCHKENIPEKKLHVHHVDYNKKNNMHDNLITFCNSCHSITNGIRSTWTKIIKDILPDLNKYGEWASQ